MSSYILYLCYLSLIVFNTGGLFNKVFGMSRTSGGKNLVSYSKCLEKAHGNLVWTVKMKWLLCLALTTLWKHGTILLISSLITEQLQSTGPFWPAGIHQSREQTGNKTLLCLSMSLPQEIGQVFLLSLCLFMD